MAAGKAACDAGRLKNFAENQSNALAALLQHFEDNCSEESLGAPSKLLDACRANASDIVNEMANATEVDCKELAETLKGQLTKLEEVAELHAKSTEEDAFNFIKTLWKEVEGQEEAAPLLRVPPALPISELTNQLKILGS